VIASSLQRRARQRGSAILESALILLLFITTCVAVVDFAQLLWIHQALTEQVRNAAQWAMVRPSASAEQIQNMVMYRESTAGSQSFLGLARENVRVTFSAGTVLNPNDRRLQVAIVDYNYHIFTPGIARTFVNNTAIMQTVSVIP
jgi:Flp pilus assembly protein TadG